MQGIIKYCIIFLLVGLNLISPGQDIVNFPLTINTYITNGEYQKAREQLNKIDSKSFSNTLITNFEARILYGDGQIKEATNKYIYLYKEGGKVTYELAKCYALLNQPELSVKYLEEYLDEYHKLLLNEIKKEPAFEKIAKSESWRVLWQKEWYNAYEMDLMEAQFKKKNNNLYEALDFLDAVTDKRSKADEAYYLKAQLYLDLDDLNQASDEIEKAIGIEDDLPEYFLLKAKIELKNNKTKKAYESISKAILMDSTQLDYYKLLSQVLVKLEKFDEAINYTELIISLHPDAENLKLATQNFEASDDFLSALKTVNQCIKKEKYNPDLYIFRANIYMKTQTYKFAEKDYSMALDFYPFNGEIYYLRGITRQKLGLEEEACRDWFKARKFGYVNAEEKITRFCRNFPE